MNNALLMDFLNSLDLHSVMKYRNDVPFVLQFKGRSLNRIFFCILKKDPLGIFLEDP